MSVTVDDVKGKVETNCKQGKPDHLQLLLACVLLMAVSNTVLAQDAENAAEKLDEELTGFTETEGVAVKGVGIFGDVLGADGKPVGNVFLRIEATSILTGDINTQHLTSTPEGGFQLRMDMLVPFAARVRAFALDQEGNILTERGPLTPPLEEPLGPLTLLMDSNARISNFRSGPMCDQSMTETGHVCEEPVTFVDIAGEDTCEFMGAESACTWYGFEYDYENVDPSIPLNCHYEFNEPLAESVYDGTIQKGEPGEWSYSHQSNAGHQVISFFTPTSAIQAGTEVVLHEYCQQEEITLFDTYFRIRR